MVTDTGNANTNAYDEFGLFRYTYIGMVGLPGGGSVVGSGPPNSLVYLNPGNQNVTYCANCKYQLAISTTSLVGAAYSGTIPAADIEVRGGSQWPAYAAFAGPMSPVYLLGSGLPSFQTPMDYGRTTNTSSADGNPLTWEPVGFRCNIPSVAEDRYIGTLTYDILHE